MSDWREMLSADVLTLGMAATGNVVTYLRVHEVTAEQCGGQPIHIPETAGETRMYATPAALDEAVAALRQLREAAGGAHRIAAFAWHDLAARGWTGPQTLRTLVEAGLNDVAELAVDQIQDLRSALDTLLGAGAQPERLTVARPVSTDRDVIIARAQDAFARWPTLRRFSPLPRTAPADKPTTGYEDVRMVALARLALQERSIEVDWMLYGPKLAQVALTFGADHLDSVSALDDATHGPRRTTIADVERNIRAAGFEPREYRPGQASRP